MEIDQVVRALRRHTGLSQRELASRAGVPRSALAAAEAGRRSPSLPVLERLLQAADLDLTLTRRPCEEASAALRAHLRRSLSERLLLALGGRPPVGRGPQPASWQELVLLATAGDVLLESPVAERLWLPLAPVGPVVVTLHEPRIEPRPSSGVTARTSEQPLPVAAIPVSLRGSRHVHVLPPAELLLDVADQLRAADWVLHAQAPRDEAGRRRPAHRDPDVHAEGWRVLRDRRYGTVPVPDEEDSRAWRLGAAASLAQQLRAGGRLDRWPDS